MREQREPWLRLPEKDPGRGESPRAAPRFRTHVVTVRAAAPALPASPVSSERPSEPAAREPVLPLPTVDRGPGPSAPAIERAAAAAALSRAPVPRPSPHRAEQPPMVAPRPPQTHAPSGAEVALDDLAVVSSTDWLAKVGEAAKMVDIVVVFYSAASLESPMFQRAFRTIVNEVLPQLGRPYAVYRFSLDAEPGFVAEMAESLGLAEGKSIATVGFAWSGPGRRPFLIGDRALDSPAMFQRVLRQNLTGERAPLVRESGGHRSQVTEVERSRSARAYSRAPLWGGRALVILAWCLFGTAALGAAVVGVAPQWASSLLHSASPPGPGTAAGAAAATGNTQNVAVPPVASPDDNAVSAPLADAVQGPAKAAKPVKHARRKHTPSWLSLNPNYWGLPEKSTH